MALVAAAAGVVLGSGPGAAAQTAPFVRHADVTRQLLVFGHADDLWVADRAGGAARRLTSGPGEKRNPRISPDGRFVAYTATPLGGRGDVYVVPIAGGAARRVTFHPADELVLDWTSDSRRILFASEATSERNRYRQLWLVDRDGGLPERLAPPYGETAALAPDGRTVWFTTTPDFQDESWKRYRGGRAPDLWRMDLASRNAERVAADDAPDSTPMLHGEAVYFLSERGPDQRSNIFVWTAAAGVRQVTHFTDADVRFPAIGDDAIVFSLEGRLQVLDLTTGMVSAPDLRPGGQDAREEVGRRAVGREVGAMAISPDARSAALEARGEVFLLDLKDGVVRNLTRTPGVAERSPVFAPDGRRLFVVSDVSGEYALQAIGTADGRSTAVSAPSPAFINTAVISPDGRWAAYVDDAMGLQLTDVASGRTHRVEGYRWLDPESPDSTRAAVSWSPDSRWLAYGRELPNRNTALVLFDTTTGQSRQLTSGFYSDFSPQFSADGRYLYCLSFRRLKAVDGDIDSTWTYAGTTTLSVLPLAAEAARPGDPAWGEKASGKPLGAEGWDLAGTEARLADLGAPNGSLSQLTRVGDQLVYLRRVDGRTDLMTFDPAARKETKRLEKVDDFVAAPAGVLLVRRGQDLVRADLGRVGEQPVDLTDLRADIVPAHENRQVVREAWRIARNRFYDPGLHGVDWDAVLQRHLAMAEAAVSHEDITFVVRDMMAELGAGHTGAYPMSRGAIGQRADDVGLLGADFALEQDHYVFRRILAPGVRTSEAHSPLIDAGVREGEYLLAVNGEPLRPAVSPFAAFQGLAERTVELTVNGRPSLEGARRVRVRTLRSEALLRELDWAERNRRHVERASGGRLGYIYVRDTAQIGRDQLQLQYKAQHHLAGLIIDARFNSGGALGDRLVELLDRPPLVYFHRRHGGDYPLPEQAFAGPKAFLTNGWSYSGGDGFPLLFKAARAGPVIGTRTWGGLIGPNGYFQLINGVVISVPPQRVYAPDGTWPNGNNGVTPDIEVLNDPGRLAHGEDQQLDRAVAYLLEQLSVRPDPTPKTPRIEFERKAP